MLDALSPPRFTYRDYRQWDGAERWELIDGEAKAMSPAPSWAHQRLVGELFFQISAFLRDRPCAAAISPIDVRLPNSDEADDDIETVVQPDLLVVCDPTKIDAAGVRGAPDLMVEVLSPSSAVRDRQLKRELYERHGVREYWLLDPDQRTLTVYQRQGERFASPVVVQDGVLESRVLPGFQLDWQRLFA
jgi:Uma2 family endonuclease